MSEQQLSNEIPFSLKRLVYTLAIQESQEELIDSTY